MFDGASKGNPGESGAGAYIFSEPSQSSINFHLLKKIPNGTNNQAEYEGLILGLDKILELVLEGIEFDKLTIKGDSNLVINQILGNWKVNSDNIKKHYAEAIRLLNRITNYGVTYQAVHIRRNLNGVADMLANQGVKHQ